MSQITQLTGERGRHYGHPKKHFECTTMLMDVWRNARSQTALNVLPDGNEEALHHGVYMILDKLARLSEDPTHIDNLDDIQGYSECLKEILNGRQSD